MSQIFYTLPARNTQNRLAKKKPLFLYDNFNIKCYSTHPLSTIQSAAARLVNSLVHGLNENKRLPRIILILPDWDIVQNIGEILFGIFDIFEQLMKWVIKAMYKFIEARKDHLVRRKAGAISYGEPKFVWVKMIDRFGVKDRALAVRNKFNRALENALSGRRNHYIFDVNAKINQAAYFSPTTKELTDDGASRFWLEIDHMVEEFEYDKEPFKPKKKENKSRRKSNIGRKQHHP